MEQRTLGTHSCVWGTMVFQRNSVRKEEREKRRPREGRKRDQAREKIIVAIKTYIWVALAAYETLLYNLFHLIFTAALGKLNSKSLLPHMGRPWRWMGFS